MKDTSFEAYIADQAMIGKIKKDIKAEEKERVLAKVCEWLQNPKHFYQCGTDKLPEVGCMFDTINEMVENFRKAMEE